MTSARQRIVIELATYAAQFGARGTAVNNAVTERRDVGRYSSCGDLVHCVLFAAGLRAGVNRDEHAGWVSGVNTSRLFVATRSTGRPPVGGELIRFPLVGDLAPGDLLCYDYTASAHVCVFLGLLPAGGVLTADYGQPGGKLRECAVQRGSEGVRLRGRELSYSLRLDSLPFESDPVAGVGAWCAARGLPVEPWIPLEYVAGRVVSSRS